MAGKDAGLSRSGPSAKPEDAAGRVEAPPAGVLVVTGPSGVGKGTVIRELMRRTPGLELSISATTRAPRPGEVNGRDYYFLSRADFDRRLAAGEFLEHAEYAGNWYGTPRSELERDCRALVLEIELQGARQVASALPEAVRVFIAPPSLAELRARLEARGAETPEQVERRLAVAERELGAQGEFAHVVTNDRLDDAVRELVQLVDTMFPAAPASAGRPAAQRPAPTTEEGPQ